MDFEGGGDGIRRRATAMRRPILRSFGLGAVFAAYALFAAIAPATADQIQRHTVQFPKGKSGATMPGSIAGYDTAEYALGARAGQTMQVKLETRSTACYFNVFAPGVKPGAGTAMFIGSTAGGEFSGVLPADGKYTVQVYLVRSAARRKESCKYQITFAIRGGASGRPRTDFAASVPARPASPAVTATIGGQSQGG